MDFALADINLSNFAGKRSLIRGEVKTGKTILVSRLVFQFMAEGYSGLVVMDLAPEVLHGVGGKMPLPPPTGGLRVISPWIAAPRLSGGSPQEVERLAQANGAVIDQVLTDYQAAPGQVLFINDVSLYLQSREPEALLTVLAATPTVVMNGYQGFSLGRDDFSKREARRMERLAAFCDLVIDLPLKT